jgi:nitroimidazol reductase NimA-like FMN-containing flavoprotein (pyridoxamine 5'-phosphate oxidase superfamily)
MCPLDHSGAEGGFADLAGEASSTRTSTGQAADVLRGRMFRSERLMSEEEAREFLRSHKVAHVGTVDAQGWPYVVPLVYVYEGSDILYLHTGDHQGHFLTNVQRHPRICVEVGEMGPVHRGKPYACNSALVYSSVIVFGGVRIVDDREKKAWFFDRLMEKYGEPGWTFEPGYPHIHRIILYEQKMEIVTGKRSTGLYH